MLWAFEIELSIDAVTGKPMVPDSSVDTGYVEGLILSVRDFPLQLKVRSDTRRKTIEESYHAACADIFAKYDDMSTNEVF